MSQNVKATPPNRTANTLKGKIISTVLASPYEIVTIELDPTVVHQFTFQYIPTAAPPTTPDAGDGTVTVSVPVPNGLISTGN